MRLGRWWVSWPRPTLRLLLRHRFAPVGGEFVVALIAANFLAEEGAAGFGRVAAARTSDMESPGAVVGRLEFELGRQIGEMDVIWLQEHELLLRQLTDAHNAVREAPDRLFEQIPHGPAVAEVAVADAVQLGEAEHQTGPGLGCEFVTIFVA